MNWKLLAGELNCVVLLCAQLNREGAKHGGPPVLSDLRDSGAIEQDSDIVVFIHHPDPPDPKVNLMPARAVSW